MRTIALLFAVIAGSLLAADRAEAAYRQFYGSWAYHSGHGYHHRCLYFKPAADDTSFRSHYCIYYASKPRYVYFWNRYEQKYWGRFDTEGKAGARYSILKEEDRREKLDEIPESAFPPPGAMPVIPGAEDGVTIDPPDLPKESETIK